MNISQLEGLQPIESIRLEDYKTQSAGGAFQMPLAGRYTLRAPSITDASFGVSKKSGAMTVEITPTITGPTNDGFVFRKTVISVKTFDRDGGRASQVGDYLKACGYTGDIPGDLQEIANLLEQTSGATYEAQLDWEADHYQSGFKVKGMAKFPKTASGEAQSWVQHPTEKGNDGEPLRLRARLVINKFIPRTN